MIRRDQIDESLVEQISGEIPCSVTGITNWTVQRGIIAEVLAWLANNPIEPTEDQRILLQGLNLNNPKPFHSSLGFYVQYFQRIAYLKKEPELPQELRDLHSELMGIKLTHSDMPRLIEVALTKAYKLGKRESSK